MCGICQCAPDFFGRKCECDAEHLSFHGDLEAGCRPDNTTTTLCNNRGECVCGKCECHKRTNPTEVSTRSPALFRNKRFMLDEMTRRNASKFANTKTQSYFFWF